MQNYPKMMYFDENIYKLVLDKEAEKAANAEGYVHHWELAEKQEKEAKKLEDKKVETDLI